MQDFWLSGILKGNENFQKVFFVHPVLPVVWVIRLRNELNVLVRSSLNFVIVRVLSEP